MDALLRSSLLSLTFHLDSLRCSLEVHLLLQLQLLPNDGLALPQLRPFLTGFNFGIFVARLSALILNLLLHLQRSPALLFVVAGEAQHLVKEIRLLVVVAVDVAAEGLQDVACVLSFHADQGTCLSSRCKIRFVG